MPRTLARARCRSGSSTRSGSNNFSGSSYYYLRHYRLEREHLVQQPRPAARSGDRQGAEEQGRPLSAGHPLRRADRDPRRVERPRTRRSSSSTTRSRGRPARTPQNRDDPAPTRRAGVLPLRNAGGPDARKSTCCSSRPPNGHLATSTRPSRRLLGDIRSAVSAPGRPRRPDRPADPAVHAISTTRRASRGIRPAASTSTSPTSIGCRRRSTTRTWCRRPTRRTTESRFPRLPGHRQPALGSLHRAGHAAIHADAEPGQRVQDRRQRRRDAVLARDRASPSSAAPGRRSGRASSWTSTATRSASPTRRTTGRLQRARGVDAGSSRTH